MCLPQPRYFQIFEAMVDWLLLTINRLLSFATCVIMTPACDILQDTGIWWLSQVILVFCVLLTKKNLQLCKFFWYIPPSFNKSWDVRCFNYSIICSNELVSSKKLYEAPDLFIRIDINIINCYLDVFAFLWLRWLWRVSEWMYGC